MIIICITLLIIVFFGISEFGTNNITFNIKGAIYLYIAIISIIFSCIIIYNKKMSIYLESEAIISIKCLLSFGIPLLLIALPIVNYAHATLASTIILIELIYIIEEMLFKNIEIKRKKEKTIYIISIILVTIYIYISSFFAIIKDKDDIEVVFNNKGILYGTLITKEEKNDIEIICNYLKEQEANGINVKILSYKANLYMIQLNKNNGILDLAFLGNLGAKGERGLIKEIANLKNTLILIHANEEDTYWQESKKARDFIINNYKRIENIQEYGVFYLEEVKYED